MITKMALPKIGVNMTEATIIRWLIKPGDTVKEGDVIMEAETDKATQDILATLSGFVAELLADEGDTVKCFDDIVVLIDKGKAYEKRPREEIHQRVIPQSDRTRVRISPLAKKIALEHHVDIRLLTPAEPGLRIVKADVLRYLGESPSAETGNVLQKIPMSPARKTIAARLCESNLEKPCAALTTTVDTDGILALRALYSKREIKLSVDAIVAKAAGHALTSHRILNSTLEGDTILVMRDINIGVAVDTDKGLMVPVLRNADTVPLAALNETLARLARDAKESKLTLSDMHGGTFTITNLGAFGVEQFTPIINPPECGILAIGAIKAEFIPDENDQPTLKKRFQMTLVFDHRIADGAPAAKFLRDVKEYIENPLLLV